MTRVGLLTATYGELLDALTEVEDDIGWLPTRCAGWTVRDVVFHLLGDAQRALVALGSPASGPADTDAVSYWRPWQPGTAGADAGRRGTRIMASAWTSVRSIVELYAETVRAVLVQARRSDPAGLVRTQGRTLSVDDLCATLAVEATVHHLDLTLAWATAGPGADGLSLARATLDGLLGHSAPRSWDDRRYVLVGTGREPLTAAERAELGADADRLPLFG